MEGDVDEDECQDHDVEKPTKNDDGHSIIEGRTNRHNSKTNNDECKESVVKYQKKSGKRMRLMKWRGAKIPFRISYIDQTRRTE